MALAFLWHWLTRAHKRRADRHVVVYTRATCPLCDEAFAVLRRFQQSHGFTVETRNVDECADWVREFGESVPVVVIDGVVRFRGHVNEVLLRRLLDAI